MERFVDNNERFVQEISGTDWVISLKMLMTQNHIFQHGVHCTAENRRNV